MMMIYGLELQADDVNGWDYDKNDFSPFTCDFIDHGGCDFPQNMSLYPLQAHPDQQNMPLYPLQEHAQSLDGQSVEAHKAIWLWRCI